MFNKNEILPQANVETEIKLLSGYFQPYYNWDPKLKLWYTKSASNQIKIELEYDSTKVVLFKNYDIESDLDLVTNYKGVDVLVRQSTDPESQACYSAPSGTYNDPNSLNYPLPVNFYQRAHIRQLNNYFNAIIGQVNTFKLDYEFNSATLDYAPEDAPFDIFRYFVDKTVANGVEEVVNNLSECKTACLARTSPLCASVQYDSNGVCLLSDIGPFDESQMTSKSENLLLVRNIFPSNNPKMIWFDGKELKIDLSQNIGGNPPDFKLLFNVLTFHNYKIKNELYIRIVDCSTNIIYESMEKQLVARPQDHYYQFILGTETNNQINTSMEENCGIYKLEVFSVVGGHAISIQNNIQLVFPRNVQGEYKFHLKATAIGEATMIFYDIVLKVIDCSTNTITDPNGIWPLTRYVPKVTDDVVFDGNNIGKWSQFKFPINQFESSVPGCRSGNYTMTTISPQGFYFSKEAIPYSFIYSFLGQVTVLYVGEVQQIVFNIDIYDLEHTKNVILQLATTFNVVDCSTKNNVIALVAGKESQQLALTGAEYTTLNIEDWFTYSVPYCNAKKYHFTPSDGVIYKNKDYSKWQFAWFPISQELQVKSNVLAKRTFQLKVQAHGDTYLTETITLSTYINDNECLGQTIEEVVIMKVEKTEAETTSIPLSSEMLKFSKQMQKCKEITSFDFSGQSVDDGKIQIVDCESQSKKCMVFQSNILGTLNYKTVFNFELSAPYIYEGKIIIESDDECRDNRIEIVKHSDFKYELPQSETTREINLDNYFGSKIPLCGIQFQLLKIDKTPFEKGSIFLTGNRIYVSQKEVFETTFLLQVESKTGLQIQQQVWVDVIQPPAASFTATISNLAPKFASEVVDIHVDFVVGEDGKLEDDSTVEFITPQAIDPEGDIIKFSFNNAGKPFLSLRKNEDNSFSLKVKRSLIFDYERQEIPVGIDLYDESNRPKQYTFFVFIDYVNKVSQEDTSTEEGDAAAQEGDAAAEEEDAAVKEGIVASNEVDEKSIPEEQGPQEIKSGADTNSQQEVISEEDFDDSLNDFDLNKDEMAALKKAFERMQSENNQGDIVGVEQGLPDLSEEQIEMLEIALVVLDEFQEASSMSDQELLNEEFIGQEVDTENFDEILGSEDQDQDIEEQGSVNEERASDESDTKKSQVDKNSENQIGSQNDKNDLKDNEKSQVIPEEIPQAVKVMNKNLKANKEEARASIQQREILKRKTENAEQNNRLRGSGKLTRSRAGYIFKGIDPKQIVLAAKKQKLKNQKPEAKKEEKPQSPTMGVEPLYPDGSIGVKFNQKVLAPQGKIDQCMYSVAFEFNVESRNDGSKTSTDFCSGNKKRNLEDGQVEGEADKMSFIPAVISHEPEKLTMNLTFTDPEYMSIGGAANMGMVIKEVSLFKSAETLESMNKDSFDKGKPELAGGLPAQIADKELASNVVEKTDVAGNFMQVMQSGNFLIALVLCSGMGLIWGMIRALQMISLSAIIDVKIPNHQFMFLQGCIIFAQMDILDGGNWFEKNFQFKETGPLNENFAFFQIPDRNFVLNSGSYFIVQAIILANHLVCFVINGVVVKFFKKNKTARKVAIWAYCDDTLKSVSLESMKLYLESYFDLVICALINLDAFLDKKSSQQGFKEYFQTKDDAMCSVITIFYTILTLTFPIFGYMMVRDHQGRFDDKNISDSVSVFTDGVRTDSYNRSMFNIYFMFRRFLTAVILVCLRFNPFFQCAFLLIFSTVNFIYIHAEQPHLSRQENRIELFNEFCIYLCAQTINRMLDASMEPELRNQFGWVFIGIAVFNIGVNLAITVIVSLKEIYYEQKTNYQNRKIDKIVDQRIQNRKILTDKAPGQFKQFEYEIKMYESVEFCKDWLVHRGWLDSNKIDYSKFDDNIRYKEIQKEFMFEQRVNMVNCTRGMKAVAERLAKAEIQKKLLKNALLKDFNRTAGVQERSSWKNSKLGTQAILQKDSVLRKGKIAQKMPSIVKRALTIKMEVINEVSEESKDLIDVDVQQESSEDSFYPEDEDIVNVDYMEEVKKQYLDVKNSSLFLGFKALGDFFSLRHHNDWKALNSKSVRKLCMQDQEFNKAVQIELKGFKQNGFQTEIEENNNQVFDESMNLDFFTEHDDNQQEIEEKIYRQLTKTPEQKLEDYHQFNGNWPLINGGINDALQAVIQCLISTEYIVKHIMSEKYNRENRRKEYSTNKIVSSTINKIFSEMWRQDLGISKKVVDISFATNNLRKWFDPTKRHDAAKMLKFVIQKLIEEEIPLKIVERVSSNKRTDSDVEKYYNSCKTSKLFQVLLSRRQQCLCGHQTSQKVTSIGLDLEYPQNSKNLQIYKMIKDHFNIQMAKQQCSKCITEGEHFWGNEQIIIECLPPILIMQINRFNEDGSFTSHDDNLIIPKHVDMLNLVKLNKSLKIDANQKTKYELIANVSCDGTSLQTSEYTTLIRKAMKGERFKQWLAYSGNREIFTNDYIAENKFPPQILIYKLVTKEEKAQTQ